MGGEGVSNPRVIGPLDARCTILGLAHPERVGGHPQQGHCPIRNAGDNTHSAVVEVPREDHAAVPDCCFSDNADVQQGISQDFVDRSDSLTGLTAPGHIGVPRVRGTGPLGMPGDSYSRNTSGGLSPQWIIASDEVCESVPSIRKGVTALKGVAVRHTPISFDATRERVTCHS